MTGRSRRLRGSRRALGALALLVAVAGAAAPSFTADAAQGHPRVVLVTNNCSEANFLCPPFEQALRSTGVSGKIISPDEREDPVATLSLLATQGYDLIVVDLFWDDTLAQVAPKFPKAHFAIIDEALGLVRGRPKNVQAVVLRTNEAAYLAGWLAGEMEKRRPGRDVVGVVGGYSFQAVDDFIVGFTAGVLRASPHARVLLKYSLDFGDPSKCEAIARSQIARGAGVVFNVAGACGLGTLRAAKRAGVWGIGVDTDQSGLGPHILTSVVKRYGGIMRTLLEQVRDGRIPGGVTTALALRDHGATLGRISPKVPASLRAGIDALSRQIVAGKLRVPGVAPR
jgi:basic membrane protein A